MAKHFYAFSLPRRSDPICGTPFMNLHHEMKCRAVSVSSDATKIIGSRACCAIQCIPSPMRGQRCRSFRAKLSERRLRRPDSALRRKGGDAAGMPRGFFFLPMGLTWVDIENGYPGLRLCRSFIASGIDRFGWHGPPASCQGRVCCALGVCTQLGHGRTARIRVVSYARSAFRPRFAPNSFHSHCIESRSSGARCTR